MGPNFEALLLCEIYDSFIKIKEQHFFIPFRLQGSCFRAFLALLKHFALILNFLQIKASDIIDNIFILFVIGHALLVGLDENMLHYLTFVILDSAA